MAYNSDQLVLGTKTALTNLSASAAQYTLVKSTATTTFSQQVTAGAVVIGVLQDRPIAGQPGLVAVAGVTKVRVNSTAHAAIAVGDKLTCSTAAGAIPSTLLTRFPFCRSLETLSSNSPATALITVQLTMEGGGSTGAAAGA